MPSYRCLLTIGLLAPGRTPGEVESAARAAVEVSSVLEAFQVDVVAGQPRVTVRFTGADDADAREIHARVLAGVRQVAQVPRAVVAKVVSGRSVPLA